MDINIGILHHYEITFNKEEYYVIPIIPSNTY